MKEVEDRPTVTRLTVRAKALNEGFTLTRTFTLGWKLNNQHGPVRFRYLWQVDIWLDFYRIDVPDITQHPEEGEGHSTRQQDDSI